MQVALQAIGIKPDDEVIVPSITYVATFQAISATGAKPVMCDIDTENLQISISDIKKKITKTKAIIPVHFSGSTGEIEKIFSYAKRKI